MNEEKLYYQKMEEELGKIARSGKQPRLLLHACCCPCSSHVIELLHEVFAITIFYYNPNISEKEELERRLLEFDRLREKAPFARDFQLVRGKYDPERFLLMAEGREKEPERGSRCYDCYEMRLRESLIYAAEKEFDYYTTTLSISPYKNADWINEIGLRLVREMEEEGLKEVPCFLMSDFKKKNGYKRSVELSREYGLYRQDYCGCRFSKEQREREKTEKKTEQM